MGEVKYTGVEAIDALITCIKSMYDSIIEKINKKQDKLGLFTDVTCHSLSAGNGIKTNTIETYTPGQYPLYLVASELHFADLSNGTDHNIIGEITELKTRLDNLEIFDEEAF